MSTAKTGTHVHLPKLGESVTEGTIGVWLKQVGDHVDRYDPLVEITTDKVNAEVPSPVSGTIMEIIAAEGETLPVGAEICVIDEGNGAASIVAVSPVATVSPVEPIAQATVPAPARAARPTGENGAMELLRTRSSPAVRRIAEEHGIDIGEVQGSGIGGRVTKSDILNVVEARRTQAAAAQVAPPVAPAPPAPARQPEPLTPPAPARQAETPPRPAFIEEQPAAGQVEVFPGDKVVTLTAKQRQIAEHMVRSERTAPHVTVWMEVDMTHIVQARLQAKERFAAEEGFDLTYLPFVIKAVVQALREHPNVNAVWDETRVIQRRAINIGVAVGLEDGLIVPVMRNADEKSIAGIARAVRDLTTRARENRLTVDDVQGGTFTVNNPGTFGTVLSTPIIVQPQSAILSTEAIIKRPVVIDDTIAIRPIMNLSMSVDHRVLDGLAAARFLSEVKRWLERFDPETSLY